MRDLAGFRRTTNHASKMFSSFFFFLHIALSFHPQSSQWYRLALITRNPMATARPRTPPPRRWKSNSTSRNPSWRLNQSSSLASTSPSAPSWPGRVFVETSLSTNPLRFSRVSTSPSRFSSPRYVSAAHTALFVIFERDDGWPKLLLTRFLVR